MSAMQMFRAVRSKYAIWVSLEPSNQVHSARPSTRATQHFPPQKSSTPMVAKAMTIRMKCGRLGNFFTIASRVLLCLTRWDTCHKTPNNLNRSFKKANTLLTSLNLYHLRVRYS